MASATQGAGEVTRRRRASAHRDLMLQNRE